MRNLRKAKGLWFALVLTLPAGKLWPVRGVSDFLRSSLGLVTGLFKPRVAPVSTCILLAVSLLTFNVPNTLAQATTGTIGGVVTDPQGAVIPGAEVTATETATGVQTKVTTNGDGVYSIPRLKPGTYTLSISKQGFKRQEFQQVTLTIAQDVTLDAILQAGQVTETVTVTATGEELNKEEVQISNTFESRAVEDLPSNGAGQGIDTLALLLPGVVPGVGNVNGNGTSLSVNGNRARSNNFTIDGGDNNDLSIGGPAFFIDDQDVVAEFQVISNNFSAEYGRNQGAIVNIVTKSGTNQYHGTAAWYHRDANFLNSLDNIQKADDGLTGPPSQLYNLWDGTFGGPIIKDKLFFFGSFEYITEPGSAVLNSANPYIAPSAFGALAAAFPGNQLVQAMVHDGAFAFPNFGSLGVRSGGTGFVNLGGTNYAVEDPTRDVSIPFNEKEFSVRGDYKITDKQSVWFRQLYQLESFENDLASVDGFTGNLTARGNLSTANWTWQVSNTAVNNFEFVRNRLFLVFGGGCSGVNCIPNPSDILDTYPSVGFAGTTTTLGEPLGTIGVASGLPQGRLVTSYQFTDNFSKVIGRHELKFGADIRRLTNLDPFLPNANGTFNFNNSGSITTNSPNNTLLAVGPSLIQFNETDTYFYFQDNWKIKDNLTLNLGIRWEYSGQPLDTIHNIDAATQSNPATAIWLQSLPLSTTTFPDIPSDKHEFAPRLGFAWTPKIGDNHLMKMLFGDQDKTVVSGGYSIAYDPSFYNILVNISTNAPTVFTSNTPFGLIANPTGNTIQAFARSAGLTEANTFNPAYFNQNPVSPGFYNPMSQQGSLRLQREFSRNQVLEVRYVWTHGTGLFANQNTNPYIANLINGFTATTNAAGQTLPQSLTFPGFPGLAPAGTQPISGSACPGVADNNEACAGRLINEGLVGSRANTAVSTYNALQVHYQARIFNQLSVGASYTFSKALDNASEIFGFTEPESPEDPFNNKLERGYSIFNRPQLFALNFVWDIPAFKDQRGILGHLAGGWQFNGIYNLASGQDYTPIDILNTDFLGSQSLSYDDIGFNDNFIGEDALRPFVGNKNAPVTQIGINSIDALLAGLVPATTHVADNIFYSMNALNNGGRIQVVTPSQVRYIVNGPGAAEAFGSPFGNATRGSLTGPTLNNWNLGLFKNIRVRESVTVQLRLEAFNAFNHPNPAVGFNAQTNITGALPIPNGFVEQAGAANGTGFGNNTNIEEAARAVQIGVKVIF
jgi:outer membrane receptor protein involved in Fe transport